MRGKTAKKLKRMVFEKLYGEDVAPEHRSEICRLPKFKEISRAAKKRYKDNIQNPVLKTSKRQERLQKQST
jgi:hypothetical protein